MDHLEYIMKKQDETCKEWKEIMELNGMFKDLENIKAVVSKMKKQVVIT